MESNCIFRIIINITIYISAGTRTLWIALLTEKEATTGLGSNNLLRMSDWYSFSLLIHSRHECLLPFM